MNETRRYEILERIGAGGFGSVYRARVVGAGGFSKLVAVKILRSDREADEEMGQRLRDEARLLGLFRHRAVVQSDGLVRLGGSWAVVMELVEGVSLRKLCAAGPVPVAAALEVCAEVAGALHAAWTATGRDGTQLRILHRDVKPSNIQITGLGEVKLLDFGIARADFESREAKTVAFHFGTDLYMAPERGDHVYGPEGDVYSLGVVLYNLLTGVQLGRAWSLEQRHRELVEEGLDYLGETYAHPPTLPEVRALLERTLAFDRARRPTARELERQLGELRLKVGGPGLRDWAEDAVQHVEDTENTGAIDELVGRVLTEDAPAREVVAELHTTPTVVLPPPPTPPPARTLRLFAPLGCAGAVLAGAVAVAVAAWASREEPDAPAAPEPTMELAPAVPVVEAPPVEVAPPPAQPVKAAEATPKAPKAPPAQGEVVVDGDAVEVKLVRAGKRYAVGKVPAGTYEVEARFEGKDPFVAATVTVPANGTVRVVCRSGLMRCK
ncbi:MAG: protein kinase domain-containing protein [Myxococcota bacterium]